MSGAGHTVDGTLIAYKSDTSRKTTTAECYALDFRSFVVN